VANKKTLHPFIAALVVAGLLFSCLGAVYAQSIPKPSIPEFTIKYVDKSFDIAPTTTIDPYNGQTITVPGSHVEASAIEIRIKNEEFSSFTTDSGNHKIDYCYNIRWKGHFEEKWNSAFLANYGSGFFPRSTGTETVFLTDGVYTCGFHIPDLNDFEPGDQIDFQVEAMIGYVVDPGPFESEIFKVQLSGWSSTQTIEVPAVLSSPVPTSAVTPTGTVSPSTTLITTSSATSPSNPTESISGWLQIGSVAALGAVVVLLFVLVVLLLRKVRVLEAKDNLA